MTHFSCSFPIVYSDRHRMAYRKLKETKQQPSLLPGLAVPDCSLVSFHFLWAFLCPQAVVFRNFKCQTGAEVEDRGKFLPPATFPLDASWLAKTPHDDTITPLHFYFLGLDISSSLLTKTLHVGEELKSSRPPSNTFLRPAQYMRALSKPRTCLVGELCTDLCRKRDC